MGGPTIKTNVVETVAMKGAFAATINGKKLMDTHKTPNGEFAGIHPKVAEKRQNLVKTCPW